MRLIANMNKADILNEIHRTTGENGGVPLGRARFLAETGIRESDWRGKHWLRWSDAVREAGYSPQTKQQTLDNDFVLEKLAELVRDLGHYPVAAEIRMRAREDAGFPSHNVFSRFGRKAEIASAVLTWCEPRPGWGDVSALCAPVAEVAPLSEDQVPEKEPEFGYVYLLRSGKYYKIGCSSSPGRREYELSIQLPERIKMVHTIKTDDPAGIENYWHRRFAAHRKNGEWFELRREDVPFADGSPCEAPPNHGMELAGRSAAPLQKRRAKGPPLSLCSSCQELDEGRK